MSLLTPAILNPLFSILYPLLTPDSLLSFAALCLAFHL
jgi:hypothetical protein